MVDASGGASGFVLIRAFVFLWRLILDIGRSIKRSFFRKPIGHFWSPEFYFGRYLGERGEKSSITHETKCIGRDDELDNLLASIDSGNISVVHITAPPGYGKSRLALEVSRRLRGRGRGVLWFIRRWFKRARWKTYFVRPDAKNVLDHVNELRKNPKVAVFIDNAHEVPVTVHELAAYTGLPTDEGQLLLICVSRSTLSNLVVDALADVPREELHTLALKKLDKDAIRKIVDRQLPNQPTELRERVVTIAHDSAFLVVYICQLIKNNVDFAKGLSDESFRRKICDFPISQAVSACDIPTNKAILASAILSAAAPVDYTLESIRNVVCKLADLTTVDYDCLVVQLIESGLFSTYAKSMLRPTPDLVGALLIDTACLDKAKPNKFADDLLSELLPNQSQQALNNLSDLGWTVGSADSVDIVGPIIDAEAKKIDADNPWACRKVIEILEPLALRRAPQVITYIHGVWSVTKHALRADATNAKEWTQVVGVAVP